ncbi:MAG: hypothetical protein ACK5HR_00530, partial [Mycoplasmatales bacterium]
IRKIEELLEGKVSGFEKMGENVEEFKEYIRNYTEELEQFDEQSVCTKPYEIETEEVKKFGKKVIKTIENKNYNKLSGEFKREIEAFEREKREYFTMDNSINLEVEYIDDEVTKSYIRRRREEIEDQMINQRRNESIMSEIQEILKKFEKFEINEGIDELQEDVDKIEQMEEYEWIKKIINWEKHNNKISFIQGVGNWVADTVEGVVWAVNPMNWGDVIGGLVWTLNPFHWDDIIGNFVKTVKEVYEEQGLWYCIGYAVPEAFSFFVGVGEVKTALDIEKIARVAKFTRVGEVVDDVADMSKYAKYAMDYSKYNKYSEILIEAGISEEEYLKGLENSIHNLDSQTLTLGKYDTDGITYSDVAKENGDTYFYMNNWDDYDIPDDIKFKIFNEPILEYAVEENLDIHLTHDPNKYGGGGGYKAELDFLKRNKYSWVEIDGEWYAKKEQS